MFVDTGTRCCWEHVPWLFWGRYACLGGYMYRGGVAGYMYQNVMGGDVVLVLVLVTLC